jgi:hypothetical protein
MRYCYFQLNPEKTAVTFQDNVKLMTYGDDNIMGVSKNAEWFNHTAIQKVLGDIGITYTMAEKEAESVPFISIWEASFLKRTWRFEEDLDDYACPLDHDSIEKSLMTWVASKTISAEEQMVAIITSAIREYFYYGREVFERKRRLLQGAIKHHKLEAYTCETTLPSWQYLVNQWHEASSKLN